MSSISLKSNLASLRVQRGLSTASKDLQKSFERLSSGLRINRASDDAAGLAIANGLHADRRVFNQGIRNLNDGLSVLNVADAAFSELSNIVIRIRELSEQSANGTVSDAQRQALDEEAQELASEFSRIVSSTSINNLKLLDGSVTSLSLQGGYGKKAAIEESLLLSDSGDATLSPETTYATDAAPRDIIFKDFNKDGKLDIATASSGGDSVSILLGQGDGTFGTAQNFTVGLQPYALAVGDFDKDGNQDIVTADQLGDSMSIILGNGDGSFVSPTSFNALDKPEGIAVGDLDEDGNLDVIVANKGSGKFSVFLGDGTGGFAPADNTTDPGMAPDKLFLQDLNGDSHLDYISAGGAEYIKVALGNGDGSFLGPVTYVVTNTVGAKAVSATTGDFNGDGKTDIVSASTEGAIGILLGNGDGTFLASTTFTSYGTFPTDIASTDFDGDGNLDVITSDSTSNIVTILYGNGDGSFQAPSSTAAGGSPMAISLADVDLDGSADVGVSNLSGNSAGILLTDNSNSISVGVLPSFSLATQAQAQAAMNVLDKKLDQLGQQKGQLGSFQSRLESAVNTLRITSVNISSAESRIRDVDVAIETAKLVKQNILQQTGSSILAQANQIPSLVLSLLETS